MPKSGLWGVVGARKCDAHERIGGRVKEGLSLESPARGTMGDKERPSQYRLYVRAKIGTRPTEPIQTPSMPERSLHPLHAVSIRCLI
jgi:hypothetical protein